MTTDDKSSVHSSSRLDDAVAFRIHRTNRLLLTHLARFLQTGRHGLSPEKWLIVAQLDQDAPMRQGDLTEPALDDAPNVSRLVESLVQAGLVERHVDPSDRRGRILQLSPAGSRLSGELMALAVEERNAVFAGFRPTELAMLTNALDRIDNNVRQLLAGPSVST